MNIIEGKSIQMTLKSEEMIGVMIETDMGRKGAVTHMNVNIVQ